MISNFFDYISADCKGECLKIFSVSLEENVSTNLLFILFFSSERTSSNTHYSIHIGICSLLSARLRQLHSLPVR